MDILEGFELLWFSFIGSMSVCIVFYGPKNTFIGLFAICAVLGLMFGMIAGLNILGDVWQVSMHWMFGGAIGLCLLALFGCYLYDPEQFVVYHTDED